MSRWETINNILIVVIPTSLTLILVEVSLAYYDFIKISPSVVKCEFTFGLILLIGSVIFYTGFSLRKLTELLVIESIKRRPFKELHTFGQIAIWNDISSNILQEGKKCIPFGIGLLGNTIFLERTFKRNMADIKRRLNTIYKDMDEDEISGNDAILIAAKKTYDEDLKQYYNENIFNKDDNWKKYGTAVPLDPITETTKYEDNERFRSRVEFAIRLLIIVCFSSYCLFELIIECLGFINRILGFVDKWLSSK
ncbi:unnamed protein product [Debaryomyces tyrocola]|nr:unnamed protein product [Debaryomyces tyrocola]